MSFRRSRQRTTRIAAVMLCLLSLSACASPPDAETTREVLSEVTEPPEQADAPVEEQITAAIADLEIDAQECAPYLVITVRGTGEPVNGQLLSPVAREIREARPESVEVLDLDYPASTDVKLGASVGAYALIETLNTQASECPQQNFVLLGYSQGALVIGDALAAPDVRIVGEEAGELSRSAAQRVEAVVLYGDPRFMGTEEFNRGFFNPDLNGLLARPPGALDEYADRIRDFCAKRDFVCQGSMDLSEEGHVEYFDNGMQQDGAMFVIRRLAPEAHSAAE